MIEIIFILSFIVFAVWATMWDEAIFELIRHWGDEMLPEKLRKPIYDCPVCQTPWYGSAAYWLIWGNSVEEWIVVIIAAMGFNAIVIKIIGNLEEIAERIDEGNA